MIDFKSDPRFKGIAQLNKKLFLASPTMHGEEQKWVDEALDTNWVSTVGPNIAIVEEQIASFVGRKYAVGLSSGTAALHLALKLAAERIYGQSRAGHGVLENRKVFCSDMTFGATVNPVTYEGGEAIFIDTEYDTWNMDPVSLEKAFELYPEVKLVILVHLYGTPGKVKEIKEIAKKHGALIVEDAAESLGAEYLYSDFRNSDLKHTVSPESWFQTGCFGDISIISFNGNKLITGSAGGILLTDSESDANKVRKWSTQARENAPWYQHEEIGYNYRMSNIIAGIIRGQIPYIRNHLDKKRIIYERYKDGLKDLPVSMNPYDEIVSKPNYWLSCLIINSDAMCEQVRSEQRALYRTSGGKSCPTEILNVLSFFNAEGRPVWKPMHLQPIYWAHGFVTRTGSGRARTNAYIDEEQVIDIGSDIFERGLCLPSDNKMTFEEQDEVIEIIHRCFW